MNEFSLEVALIWARANAEASVSLSAKDFSASVAGVALEVQRLIAEESALAIPGSTCALPSAVHLQQPLQCSETAATHVQTERVGE